METGAIVPFQSRFHAKFLELQIKLVKQLPQFFNAPQTVAPLLPSFSSTSQANRTSLLPGYDGQVYGRKMPELPGAAASVVGVILRPLAHHVFQCHELTVRH